VEEVCSQSRLLDSNTLVAGAHATIHYLRPGCLSYLLVGGAGSPELIREMSPSRFGFDSVSSRANDTPDARTFPSAAVTVPNAVGTGPEPFSLRAQRSIQLHVWLPHLLYRTRGSECSV